MGSGIWCWVGLLWTDRVHMVLDRYGDRISDLSIFGWSVDTDGSLTQTFNPNLLNTYRAKWPHIRFWACFRNMEAPSGAGPLAVFNALRFSAPARAKLSTDLAGVFAAHPWLHGVDIDMEGGGNLYSVESEALFQSVTDTAHGLGKEASAALPALTSSGSVGGENWVRYQQLGNILDHVSIMAYDMAWAGSAPGPIAPGFWVRDVASWAASQIDPAKVSLGVPCYSRAWSIHDYPTGLYRGVSSTYYGARNWADGTWPPAPGTPDMPEMAWLAFRNPEDKVPFLLPGIWDWTQPQGRSSSSGVIFGPYAGRWYGVRYGKASGTPMWAPADNTAGSAHAEYVMAPRPMRDIHGNWSSPRHGLNLTVELLQRPPDSATILDEDCRDQYQLTSALYTRTGTWTHWHDEDSLDVRPYGQYRVGSGGGGLGTNHNFGVQSLHVLGRGQLPASGWMGVRIGNVRAEVNDTGTLRITNGGTVVASTSVTVPGVSSTPGSGTYVIAMRIRDGSVRVYSSQFETTMSLRLQATVPVADGRGSAGLWSSGAAWWDHFRLGDGWWYQPREAVEVLIGDQSWVLGRIPRTDVVWDEFNRFRPLTDVEESATRTESISLDWVYHHIVPSPLSTSRSSVVRVVPLDVDCWVGRLFACDSEGGRLVYYSDAEHLRFWADTAFFEYGFQGVSLWTLGQEDVRSWEVLRGGQLPADAMVGYTG